MHDLSVIVQVASYSIAVCPIIHICAAFIVKSAQATSFTVQHAIVCAAFVFLAVCDSPHTFGFKSVTIQIGAYFARVFAFHPFPSFLSIRAPQCGQYCVFWPLYPSHALHTYISLCANVPLGVGTVRT